MTAILFTAFGACTLVPYISFRCKKKLMPGILLKVATSIFFILTTSAAILIREPVPFEVGPGLYETYKFLFFGVLLGQVFGLMGDFWLDMKDMYLEHKDTYIFSGFICFLIGHLFFIAGLLKTYGANWDTRQYLLILGGGAVLCGGVLLTEKPMKLAYGKFKGITAAYSAVFGASIAAAFCSWYFGGKNPQPLVMTIGLVIFLLSDLVLSGTFFGKGKDRPADYILNYIFYFGGQFTIALSLLVVGQ